MQKVWSGARTPEAQSFGVLLARKLLLNCREETQEHDSNCLHWRPITQRTQNPLFLKPGNFCLVFLILQGPACCFKLEPFTTSNSSLKCAVDAGGYSGLQFWGSKWKPSCSALTIQKFILLRLSSKQPSCLVIYVLKNGPTGTDHRSAWPKIPISKATGKEACIQWCVSR